MTFRERVECLTDIYLEKPPTLAGELVLNWYEVVTCQYRARDAAFLANVTKKNLISFYRRYVRVNAPLRTKFAVYVVGNNVSGKCGVAPSDVTELPADFLRTPKNLPAPTLVDDIVEFIKR